MSEICEISNLHFKTLQLSGFIFKSSSIVVTGGISFEKDYNWKELTVDA